MMSTNSVLHRPKSAWRKFPDHSPLKRASVRQTMTRKYTLVIEGVSVGYSAYVPELPTILVTGRSVEELTDRAAESIHLYWDAKCK